MAGINRNLFFEFSFDTGLPNIIAVDPWPENPEEYSIQIREISIRNNQSSDSSEDLSNVIWTVSYYQFLTDSIKNWRSSNESPKDNRIIEFSKSPLEIYRTLISSYLDVETMIESTLYFHDGRTATSRKCVYKSNSKFDSLKVFKKKPSDSDKMWFIGFMCDGSDLANLDLRVSIAFEF